MTDNYSLPYRHMDTLSMDDAHKYSTNLLGDRIPIDGPQPMLQNTARSGPRVSNSTRVINQKAF
jgi:hypothetical protein